MKRFAFCLFLFFALFLIGCSKPTEEPNKPAPTPEVTYTVKWYDEEGSLLKEESLKENSSVSYNYNKADTAEWDYTFEGWASSLNGTVLSSLPKVSSDTSYYAVVSKVKQKYTINFDSDGGTEIGSMTLEYGSSVDMPTEPTKEGYKFVGWTTSKGGDTLVEFPIIIERNTTIYAKYNEVVSIKGLLEELLEGYDVNPLCYIPDSLKIGAINNAVLSNPQMDYSNFVNVSQIRQASYGEQLNMLMDNINESMKFHVALSAIEAISSSAVTAFNNYLDKNPSDSASYDFASGIYNCNIEVTSENIKFIIDYTKELPIFSEQTIQIVLMMNRVTKEKEVRIQIGEANSLKYIISENEYTFAINYLGVRTAYISIVRDGNEVVGNVYEYLTYEGKGIKSACDFYINDQYAKIVGNKASGFIGFTGYINELYDVKTGKLLGYEVQETLSKITYNTLWFNLSDVLGLSNIKALVNPETNATEFYVNSSSKAFANKTVGGFSLKMASRRFDIEYRTQYFYQYDAQAKSYIRYKVNVPMMFVQEEFLDTFTKDVTEVNKNLILSVGLNQTVTTQIMEDYKTLIPLFIENKETITEEYIKEFIGLKK